uniref:Mitogen-activated protein kinase n=1 Tax=Palpitomonas bilix TaxID=652834 RepID=A0A7S3GB87_9EUKA|mmetsp:Transcript_42606/g.109594  ORF Transcript_42606/g.109594 Transcript_42606/m.109594 type:complete len:354 (+) Transcript_42606:260-1321(+)
MVFKVNGIVFDVPDHYELTNPKPLGKGAYGVVVAAKDKRTGVAVAIKKIIDTFADLQDAKCIVREIRLLNHLKHANIIRILDVLMPPTKEKCKDVYIVFERMDADLQSLIYSTHDLVESQISYFLYQMLLALKYIHQYGVLHRDLKPGNLLVNANCDLKVCDFGLARKTESDERENPASMTMYVITRWWRPPELLWEPQYTSAVDIWSVGCIMAELYNRKPLFRGNSSKDQLDLIVRKLGKPSKEDIDSIADGGARKYIHNLPPSNGTPLDYLVPTASPAALDLMKKLLAFMAGKRISAEEALKHEYFAEYHGDDTFDEGIPPGDFKFEFEDHDLTEREIRDLLYEEVLAVQK